MDTTAFTNKDYSLRMVDSVGRDMGPVNVIFGIMGSNRGIWTFKGFAGPANSYLSGLAIKRGLVSKQHILNRYGIKGIWPFHGKPGELRHDNGSEFVNSHLARVLKELNICFDDLSPPETPHERGINERFNRTAHSLIREFLESEIGKRYLSPVQGNPTALGITLDNLDRALTEWIVCDYHYRAHKGMGGDSPLSRFEKFAEGGNGLPASGIPMPLEDSKQLIWDFLWVQERTVNHLGISFGNRRYSSSELGRLFATNRRSSGRKVSFRFNPYCMKSIFIKVPNEEGREETIEVPWIPEIEKYRPSVANQVASVNPSLWEWEVLYAEIRRGCTSNPTRGVVESLHEQRESAAAAGGSMAGAPNPKTRIRDARNRGMRQYGEAENVPAVGTTQSNGEAQAGTSNQPQRPPRKPRQPRTSTPVYLPVGDGADAY